MQTTGIKYFVISLLLVATAIPAQAIDLGGHVRDGVVINFNMGAGWSWLDFSIPNQEGETVNYETDTEADLAGGLSIGWARSDNLVFSLGVYGWKAYYWYTGDQLSASTTQFDLDVCWFPRGEGFWLKAGAGPGNISFTAVAPQINVTFQEWGWNYLAGAGYELRLSDTMAFGAAYEYRGLGVGAFKGLDDTVVSSHNALFSFRWYMD